MTTTEKTVWWKSDRFWWGIYIFVTLFLSVKEMFTSSLPIGGFGTGNGNYSIFYHSFWHLWEGKTLYGFYPTEYDNRYNYSPTFAFLMTPFALLPYHWGGLLWNVGNGIFFFSGLRQLSLDQNKRFFLYWFIIFEAYTSLINFQTNPSLVALIVWTWVMYERKQYVWVAFFMMIGTWTKVLGLASAIFWFFYPKKPQVLLYCVAWSVVLFCLPLCYVSFSHLLFLYQDWFAWLVKHNDMHGNTDGLMNWHALCKRILGLQINNGIFIIVGGLALLGSLAYQRRNLENAVFKMLVLANVLIFITVFNPGAESPSFVIAMTGVSIWYAYSPRSTWHIALAVFAFVITGLSQTDLFPPYIRKNFIHPYALKALPCVVIWVVSAIELYLYQPSKEETNP